MNLSLGQCRPFLKAFFAFICSRRVIPTIKGTIAYTIALILMFSTRFNGLTKNPIANTSMMIVVITGGPGRSMGECVQAIALVLTGACLGSVNFVILAHLSHSPIAQGFIFAGIVYVMTIVKTIESPKYLGFSLVCVLNSFNGIYTGFQSGGFSSSALVSYLASYLWGGAIVLAVNFIVFPKSSERELRESLVTSLKHIGTFAHLLAKGYALEANQEEITLTEHMATTIRADFGYLRQKIQETTIEINYSQFSMNDYKTFVSATRRLQQALITANSSLSGMSKQDIEPFKNRFLPDTLSPFNKLRRAIDLTIRDLGTELACTPMVIPATQARYQAFLQSDPCAELHQNISAMDNDEIHERLKEVSGRLTAEVANAPVPSTRPGTPDLSTPETTLRSPGTTTAHSSSRPSKLDIKIDNPKLYLCSMDRLRREFDLFSARQHNSLQVALTDELLFDSPDPKLRVDEPLRMRDMYGTDGIDMDGFQGESDSSELRRRNKTNEKARSLEKRRNSEDRRLESTEKEDSENLLFEGDSLIRVWGFMFALEQFVDELQTLWTSIRPAGINRQRRLHIHIFETLRGLHQNDQVDVDGYTDMPLPEALALLEKRPYTPIKSNIWQRLNRFQKLIDSPTSIFAAKTAAAATVYATLIYTSAPRPWFISFALNSGILTIVVALAPTLGQSILSFMLQIAGSAIGYLWGLAVLEMFHNVGGYTYNPFGMVCLLVPYAFILQFLLYERPALFVLALLAMNGTSVLVGIESISVEYLHRTSFDSPLLRTGKAITALGLALAIVAIFQLFILRTPARRTLRKTVAALTYQTLSYMVLVYAFGRAQLASRPDSRPSRAALLRVDRELRQRELKLQSAIIQVSPLVNFAAAEPQFSKPFKKDAVWRLIRGNQIVLDRLREARAALGTGEYQEFIVAHLASTLAPYRARNTRLLKTELYLIASSLHSKAPLPQFTPTKMLFPMTRANFIHDCLVVSRRYVKTSGTSIIQSQEYLRYMSYILCSITVVNALMDMEDASKELFGQLEETLL